ncbi:MAG: nucleotidyltransferase family protein [Deltaproteobacteria bacterium]|nr:nucleotidyltransferase family protein [Deltaproteobacteria bacterium]
MTSLEQKILACSAELYPDSYQQQKLQRLMLRCMDVDHLIGTAFDGGLAGFLYKSLTKSNLLDILDKRQVETLRNLYHGNVVFNLKLLHDFKEILHQLNQKKIKVIPLKGIILLKQVYHDIGLRQLTDIDLWIPGRDHREIIQTLTALGYQSDPAYPGTFRRRRTTIDLHSHILGAERIGARKFILARGQSHFYTNARSMDFEGEDVLSLNKYDQVIILSLHALKHNAERMIWLVDIKGLLADWKKSDWEALINRVRYMGQEKSVSYIFFLIRHLFDFFFPPEVSRALKLERLNFMERRLLKERLKKGSLPIWAALFLFSPDRGLWVRIYSIFETLFPRPEILKQNFVSSRDLKVWELYLKRVCQLINMAKNP